MGPGRGPVSSELLSVFPEGWPPWAPCTLCSCKWQPWSLGPEGRSAPVLAHVGSPTLLAPPGPPHLLSPERSLSFVGAPGVLGQGSLFGCG